MLQCLCLCATFSLAQTPPPEAAPPPPPAATTPDRWLLMQSLQGTWPGWGLDSHHTQVYGWIQQGFAANPAGPTDRINFGANEDWRSNDYRLNQAYIVLEK